LWRAHEQSPGSATWAIVIGVAVLAAISLVLARSRGGNKSPAVASAAWIAAYAAILLAALSPWVSLALQLAAEPDAETTLKNLWRAEKTFAAKEPGRFYTCEGPLLPGFERAAWVPFQEQGLIGRAQMRRGRYLITLRCGPAAHFDIVAAPQPPRGTIYSIDETGAIRSRR
jgi:hypothetical protein